MDGGGASILNPGNKSTKEISPCQTVNIEKKNVPDNGLWKNNSMPSEGYKKNSAAKVLKYSQVYNVYYFRNRHFLKITDICF